MKFLTNWTIDLDAIPAYVDFNKDFNEHIDLVLAHMILESDDERLTHLMKQDFQKLVDRISNGALSVKYSPRYGFGRRYPECPDEKFPNGKPNPAWRKYYSALISQPRIIKNTIFKYQDWVDIDQKKGHPTILLSVAKKNNIKLDSYEEYLLEGNFDRLVRDMSAYYSVDDSIVDKKDIKWLFNKTIYGGGHAQWCEDIMHGKFKVCDGVSVCIRKPKQMKNTAVPFPFYQRFYEDTRRIIDLVYLNNASLCDVVCRDIPNDADHLWRRKNCVMAYFCGILENEISFRAYKWLVSNNIIEKGVIDWGYDGMTFPNPNVDFDYIAEMNEHVRLKTGFHDVTFVLKEFDDDEVLNDVLDRRTEYIMEPPANQEIVVRDTEHDDEHLNDVDESTYVLSKYPHWKKCRGELYCFDDQKGFWTSSSSTHLRIIQQHARGKYKKSVPAMKNIHTFIGSLCEDDNFMERNADSSIGYLLFNNGYYEAKTGKFYDKFNPNIVFFAKIDNDFVRANEDDMEDIKRRFFYEPLSVLIGDYYLQILARGLMGDKMKKIVFGLGQTDCGKSTLSKAISRAFGDYIGTFNAGNFIKKEHVADDAQALRWALKLRYKRLIFSNEMDATKELNGNEIKKLTGHDDLVGRGHCQDETSFNPHFLPVVFANDMPPIKPYDDALDNRVEVVSYKRKFVDEPCDEFELKKDHGVAQEIETTKFKQTMISLFICEYEKYLRNRALPRPEECQNAKKDWIDQDIGSLPAFLRDFELTDDVNDKVPSRDIEEWLKGVKLGITMKKFGMELKLHIGRMKFKNIVNKVVSIEGKKLQAWVGVKKSG